MRITHALVLWNALVALASSQELTRGPFPVGVLHPLQERVWVVDAGGGGDFTELQPAIDAAGSGDVLLLRSDVPAHSSGEFVVQGKGLSIIGEGVRRRIGSGVPGTNVGNPGDGCKNAIIVRDVPSGEEVVLRNLSFEAFCKAIFGFGFPGLAAVVRLEESAGSIWVEDCGVVILPGTDGALTGYPTRISGIDISDCASATLVRTTVSGPPGLLCCSEGLSQSQALRIAGSTVSAFECEFIGRIGGQAWQANFTPDAEGDDAVRIEGSFLFASQCRFEGGRGGATQYPCGTEPGADGGAGALIDGTSEVHALSCAFVGGGAGSGLGFGCPAGQPGEPAVVAPGGMLVETIAPSRTYSISSPVAGGSSATLVASGPAGDLVLSLIGSAPDATFLPVHLGVQLVAPPFQVVVEGTIPAGGVLSRNVTLPVVPPPSSFVETFRQGFFFEPGGSAFLASGSAVLALAQ